MVNNAQAMRRACHFVWRKLRIAVVRGSASFPFLSQPYLLTKNHILSEISIKRATAYRWLMCQLFLLYILLFRDSISLFR